MHLDHRPPNDIPRVQFPKLPVYRYIPTLNARRQKNLLKSPELELPNARVYRTISLRETRAKKVSPRTFWRDDLGLVTDDGQLSTEVSLLVPLTLLSIARALIRPAHGHRDSGSISSDVMLIVPLAVALSPALASICTYTTVIRVHVTARTQLEVSSFTRQSISGQCAKLPRYGTIT